MHDAPGYSAPQSETVKVCPAAASTPHTGSLDVSELVPEAWKEPQNPSLVGMMVGADVGTGVGAVGLAVGGWLGELALTVGFAVGNVEGTDEGFAVVGTIVGSALGANDGIAVGESEGLAVGGEVGGAVMIAVGIGLGRFVGVAVGAYVTSFTPAPDTTAVPEHNVMPMQPSWIRYVSVVVPAGTVYCTCAHTLPPDMHAAGGRPPVPVSSYTTSTPVAE